MSQRSVHDVGLLRSQSGSMALTAFLWLDQQKDHAWVSQTLPTSNTNPDRAYHHWQVHIAMKLPRPDKAEEKFLVQEFNNTVSVLLNCFYSHLHCFWKDSRPWTSLRFLPERVRSSRRPRAGSMPPLSGKAFETDSHNCTQWKINHSLK